MVSILTPTYNRVSFLREAAAHVLEQSFRDFEWIIVDDGSTDGTEEMIRKIPDARIKYFK